MSAGTRGLTVAALQLAIVCSLAGKYYVDRVVRPRLWVRSVGYDPEALIRGRYVRLGIAVDPGSSAQNDNVRLDVQRGRLVAIADRDGRIRLARGLNSVWSVGPVAFFIPEGVPDPTRRIAGEELWVEVTVPRQGLPRPIRLGVKRNGRLDPLEY